jgi:AraC-like DNA-binding protein
MHRYEGSNFRQNLSSFVREYWRLPLKNDPPFYPYCFEEVIRRNYAWYQEYFCNVMIVVIVMDGNISYRINERELVLDKGQILVIPEKTSYFFETGPARFYHKVVIEFAGRNLMSVMECQGLDKVTVLESEKYLNLADDARHMANMFKRQYIDDVPDLLGDSVRFLSKLAMMLPFNQPDEDAFSRARRILEQHFEQKISIHSLATEVGCSLTTLERIFKTKIGITPMRYRIEKKIEKAAFLLVNTSISLKEIAYQLGYCHQFHFSQEFCRIMGCSPRQYRKERVDK